MGEALPQEVVQVAGDPLPFGYHSQAPELRLGPALPMEGSGEEAAGQSQGRQIGPGEEGPPRGTPVEGA